jgi:hypothetical protein
MKKPRCERVIASGSRECLTPVGFLGTKTRKRAGAGTLSGGEVTVRSGVGALVAAR